MFSEVEYPWGGIVIRKRQMSSLYCCFRESRVTSQPASSDLGVLRLKLGPETGRGPTFWAPFQPVHTLFIHIRIFYLPSCETLRAYGMATMSQHSLRNSQLIAFDSVAAGQ